MGLVGDETLSIQKYLGCETLKEAVGMALARDL